MSNNPTPNRPDEREAALAKLDVVADALQVACGKFASPHGVDLAQWSIDLRAVLDVIRRDAPREGGEAVDPSERQPCNPHPDAPHGFNRTSSHSLGRYVCECEGWLPDEPAETLGNKLRDVKRMLADAPERDAVGASLSWVTPAVEAAAAALYATDRACGEPRWDALDWGRRMHYQQRAKVAVDAAALRAPGQSS